MNMICNQKKLNGKVAGVQVKDQLERSNSDDAYSNPKISIKLLVKPALFIPASCLIKLLYR